MLSINSIYDNVNEKGIPEVGLPYVSEAYLDVLGLHSFNPKYEPFQSSFNNDPNNLFISASTTSHIEGTQTINFSRTGDMEIVDDVIQGRFQPLYFVEPVAAEERPIDPFKFNTELDQEKIVFPDGLRQSYRPFQMLEEDKRKILLINYQELLKEDLVKAQRYLLEQDPQLLQTIINAADFNENRQVSRPAVSRGVNQAEENAVRINQRQTQERKVEVEQLESKAIVSPRVEEEEKKTLEDIIRNQKNFKPYLNNLTPSQIETFDIEIFRGLALPKQKSRLADMADKLAGKVYVRGTGLVTQEEVDEYYELVRRLQSGTYPGRT